MRAAPALIALGLALTSPSAAAQASREWRTDFSRHTVPLEEVVSGGPPKDGIPALDRPRFVPVPEADAWLSPREPVVLVENGIVNDVVGGRPVAVTYCPLCNTALAFDRRLDGKILAFARPW